MLTHLLMRDESTAGLGKTNNNFVVLVSGKTISSYERIRQSITQGMKESISRESVVLRLLVQLVGA